MKTAIIFVLVIFLIASWALFLIGPKTDGRLIIDEAADSWTISITTKPEELKTRKEIILAVVINKRE